MRLHVHEWGELGRPRVVCLHGVQGYGGRFRRLAEERLASRFHVLAPDLRGHGRSGWDEPWTIEAHLNDLRETFSEPAGWIGHSFGGRLVFELAAARPELVERAALLDPALVVPADYAEWLAEDELAADVSYATPEEAIVDAAAELLAGPPPGIELEVSGHLDRGEDGRYRARYSRGAVAAGYREVARPPPRFDDVRARLLVVAGRYSKFVSVGEEDLLRSALGERFELRVVPAGHMVFWEAFDETADAIEGFLAG